MIYINFEQLGTPTVRPALLGVLRGRGTRSGGFSVYVLDAQLVAAAVTSRACRVADLATALAEILAEDGPVVSWSAHDRRIVKKAQLPQRLVQQFESRWVNALADVRRWKRRLYPDWNLPETANSNGNALKAYMKAVGYEVRRSSPRHSAEWHPLLECNRHHCLGMRAVYQRACRELALEKSYRQTTYRVETEGASYPIRIGRLHGALDTALRGARATTWACVTAYNPQSAKCSVRENRRRGEALKRYLRARHIRWHVMEGVGDAGDWPSEPGVLALGVSRARAENLGREFGQAAVVWGRAGEKAELVWCNPLQKVTRRSQ